MLTLEEDMDKILMPRVRCGDYITKPFNILEVKARIKAILRRTQAAAPAETKSRTIELGGVKMDCEGRRVFVGDKEIYLTAKEFDVLELLMMSPNKVFSRDSLNTIWGHSIRATCAPSTCTSAVSARRSRRAGRSRSMYIQNGVWAIISRDNKFTFFQEPPRENHSDSVFHQDGAVHYRDECCRAKL